MTLTLVDRKGVQSMTSNFGQASIEFTVIQAPSVADGDCCFTRLNTALHTLAYLMKLTRLAFVNAVDKALGLFCF